MIAHGWISPARWFSRRSAWLGVVVWLGHALPAHAEPLTTPARTDCDGLPLPAGALARVGSVRLRHGQWIWRLEYSPDGNLLASSGGGLVRVWDRHTGNLVWQVTVSENRQVAGGFFSADGKAIVVVDGDNLRWLDARTGKEVRHCDRPLLKKGAEAFLSPGGRQIAVLQGDARKEFVVYELPSGTERFRKAAEGAWSEVAWPVGAPSTTGGTTIAALEVLAEPPNQRRRVWLLDSGTGKALGNFDPILEVPRLEFSHDGKSLLVYDCDLTHCRLAAGWPAPESDRLIRIWSVPEGKLLRSWEPPVKDLAQAAFAPDDRSLVVSYWNSEPVRIDLQTGKEVGRFRGFPSRCGVAFSPDGKTLATGCGLAPMYSLHFSSAISQWDLATARCLPASADPVADFSQLRFDDGGKLLWVCSNEFQAIDWLSGRVVQQITVPHQRTGLPLCLAPDRSRLAGLNAAYRMAVWDVASGKELCALPLKYGWWHTPAFSADGRVLYTSGAEGQLQAWDSGTGKERPFTGAKPAHFKPLAVSPDGRWLAGPDAPGLGLTKGLEADKIAVWDVAANYHFYRLGHEQLGNTVALAFTPDGNTLAAVGHTWATGDQRETGALVVWDLVTGKERVAVTGMADHPMAVVLSADGRTVATANADNTVCLRETATGKERVRFAGHQRPVAALAFSPDGKLLATASTDAPAFIWDVEGRYGQPPSAEPFSDGDRVRLWDGLASADAAMAFAAMRQLLARPGPAVALLREEVRRAAVDDAELARLVRDLDDDAFSVREHAAARLLAAGDQVETRLRVRLAKEPSAEVRRRLERILDGIDLDAPARHRERRLVEVLERLATPEARQLLQALAGGSHSRVLTREARAAVGRLKRR
jgi:WD40 repeat protein